MMYPETKQEYMMRKKLMTENEEFRNYYYLNEDLYWEMNHDERISFFKRYYNFDVKMIENKNEINRRNEISNKNNNKDFTFNFTSNEVDFLKAITTKMEINSSAAIFHGVKLTIEIIVLSVFLGIKCAGYILKFFLHLFKIYRDRKKCDIHVFFNLFIFYIFTMY